MRIKVNKTPEREAAIKAVLPKVPLTQQFILPTMLDVLRPMILPLLLAEIEVYKNYPKNNGKFNPEAFEPRNNKTCFMGHAFFANGTLIDSDLEDYRKAIGTLSHPVWGKAVTLLEIWGADHINDYRPMVEGVYRYAFGDIEEMPKVDFYINPFILTEKTGAWKADEEDIAAQRSATLAMENEYRRQNGLPLADHTLDEMEANPELKAAHEAKIKAHHDKKRGRFFGDDDEEYETDEDDDY